MLDHVLYETGSALAYCGVGILLMGLGFVLVDVLTPGKLADLIWRDRNRNASILLASNLLGVAVIVVAAIAASDDSGLGTGVLSTTVYGVAGLLVMGVAFLVLDVVTPGKLGALLADSEPHPAVWVSAAMHVAIGFVVGAALL